MAKSATPARPTTAHAKARKKKAAARRPARLLDPLAADAPVYDRANIDRYRGYGESREECAARLDLTEQLLRSPGYKVLTRALRHADALGDALAELLAEHGPDSESVLARWAKAYGVGDLFEDVLVLLNNVHTGAGFVSSEVPLLP